MKIGFEQMVTRGIVIFHEDRIIGFDSDNVRIPNLVGEDTQEISDE